MKKYMFYVPAFLFSLASQGVFAAQETVNQVLTQSSQPIEQSLKSTSHDPSIFSVLFALLVVVFLIYITGVIYSKLNIVGAKTVQQQIKKHDISRAFVVSTTQLGQGKNLHVIEIDKKRYLIGATQSSISMLKELGVAEIESKIDRELINVTEIVDGEETVEQLPLIDEFDVHKKYL